ncbi:D-cysteine desulfhydrase family protein [Microtetraspora fusca]|uniref:D-cysteine desulfhydrase family protein n=1 Tax=Microtetraspora fusca TaxID=1997 RepID=UPI000834FD5B|nr:D-cysteine desulfhydrase family protein [Microtetraspora fusca]
MTTTPVSLHELTRRPRRRFGTLTSEVHPLSRLQAALADSGHRVPNLWIKRDDRVGLAGGGNKARKLEFLVGDALARGATALVTSGAVQSNHARQTAAAAAASGLACTLVLQRKLSRDVEYDACGNVFLDELLGARIVSVAADEDLSDAVHRAVASLEEQGHRPYVVPVGGSNATGSLGYVECAHEIVASGVPVDRVVLATGSSGTHAGLLSGFTALDSDISVLGFCVYRDAEATREAVTALSAETLAQLTDRRIDPSTVAVDDLSLGPGYGVPTTEMLEAVRLVAQTEGVLLDPVYTGKAMAGLLRWIREGRFSEQENVLFLHTGGIPGLFAYRTAFS